MSESENNRNKRNSVNPFKGFDLKRKRLNELDDTDKQKLLSNYLPQSNPRKEEPFDQKAAKPALNFSELFHKKVKKEAIVIQDDQEMEAKGVDGFLNEYEQLRLEYEQDGISQSSILLLQRKAKQVNNNPGYPNIDQTPVLKELLSISKKLMMNDFEIIIWMIWLKILGFPQEQAALLDFLEINALYVKKSNNPESLYRVFEKFYSHNHTNFYARFKNSESPNIQLTSMSINEHFKEIMKDFDYKKEKTIKDYNFEVDALEAEHDKREVHTTTKFEDEKLKIMEEEARRSNALLNYGKKGKNKVKEEKSTPTNKRSRKMADKELEQIKEDLEGGKNNAKNTLPSEIGGVRIEKFKGEAAPIKLPSYNSKAPEQPGFIPPMNAQTYLSSSILDMGASKGFNDIFHGQPPVNDPQKDKNGSIKYIKLCVNGDSNPGSLNMPSFHFGPDDSKHPKAAKMSPNASFQSNLPIFGKDGTSAIFNNKSGSIDAKFAPFIGAPGSSFNLTSKFPPDNQK